MVYNREKYKLNYLLSKEYVVYILKIVDKNIYKIGKTNSLKHRLINLKQSIYEEIVIHSVISCQTNTEALLKEKWLQHQLESYRIPSKKEWFKIPDEIILLNKVYELENDYQVLYNPAILV